MADTTAVISVTDPAIDVGAMTEDEMGRYAATRDISLLKFKPGRKPTRYFIRPIPRSVIRYIREAASKGIRYGRAFCAAVVRVENYYPEGSSKPLDSWAPSDPKAPMMTDEESDLFVPADVEDVGAVAWQRSFLGHMSERRYVLPLLLLEQLDRMIYLPAEQSDARTSNATRSDEPDSTASEKQASAPSSDAPTVAHATEAAITP